jgi:hypothetical protein
MTDQLPPVNVRMTDQLRGELQKLAYTNRRTLSDYIRLLLSDVLDTPRDLQEHMRAASYPAARVSMNTRWSSRGIRNKQREWQSKRHGYNVLPIRKPMMLLRMFGRLHER